MNTIALLSEAEWDSVAGSLQLSGREFQIVRHLFDGHPEASVSEALGMSAHTVHTHIERLYLKLHVHRRADLVLRVFAAYIALASAGLASAPSVKRKSATQPTAT